MNTILYLALLVAAAGYHGSEAMGQKGTTDEYGWTTDEYDDYKGWVSCGCHDAPSCRQCGTQPHLCNGDCAWTWSGCRLKTEKCFPLGSCGVDQYCPVDQHCCYAPDFMGRCYKDRCECPRNTTSGPPGPTRPPHPPTGETPVSMGTRPPPTGETPVSMGTRPPPTGETPVHIGSTGVTDGVTDGHFTGETTSRPGTNGTTAEGCPAPVKPSSPSNGYWFCAEESCHLECDPGYAPTNRTSIYQTSNCSWSIPPESLTCSPAVALIIGGLIDAIGAEVYGPDIHYRLPNLPDTRVGGSLDYVDSFIIACGGSLITFPPKPPFPLARNNCIEMSNNLTWSHHSTMHQSRDLQANAVNLGKLTLLGGTDAPTSQDTIQPGKSALWEENTIKKTKYSCAAKISATEFVVTAGEYNPNETLKYNTLTGEITKLADLNQERSGHGCAFVKHGSMAGVIVAGGLPMGHQQFTENVANITTGSTEFFSTETNEWRTLGNLTMPRRGLKLVFVQDQLYAMGGFNGTVYVATVEKFNFENETWSFAEDMFAPRAFAGVAAVPRHLFSDTD